MDKRKTKKLVYKNVRRYIEELNKRHIKIEQAYIFGSYVKGTATKWSDIDVALLTDRFLGDSFDFKFLLMKVARDIDPDIEPHPYLITEFKKENPMASEVIKTGIRVY